MQRSFAFSGPQFWLFFLLAAFLFMTAFPLFLLLAASITVVHLIKKLFSSGRPSVREGFGDPNVSPVIDNKKIGPYRVRKSETDPDVIEVIE